MTDRASANERGCEHVWERADLHVCPSIARVDNQHAHCSWAVCITCGAGGYGATVRIPSPEGSV